MWDDDDDNVYDDDASTTSYISKMIKNINVYATTHSVREMIFLFY